MSRIPRKAMMALAGAIASIVLAACGSTVQTDQPLATTSGTQGSPLGAVAPLDGSLGAPGTPGGALAPPGASGPGLTGPDGTLVPPSAGDPAVSPTTGLPVPDAVPETATTTDAGSGPVSIGVAYPSNGDAANAAIGAAGVTLGDVRSNMQAVINDINERGGIDGRPIEVVYHAYDAQSSDTKSNQDQAACSDFTDDNEVLLVIGSGQGENLDACLAKAGIPQVVTGILLKRDEAYFDRYPTLFDVTGISHDRVLADEASVLARQGYFSGWNAQLGRATPGTAEVGILSIDAPAWSVPLKNTLLPSLARQGVRVDSDNVVEVYTPPSSAEAARTVTDIQNAVLRFRSNGVTHVILMDTDGDLLLLYAQAARLQGYLPRLGLSSASGAQALYDSGVVSDQQLSGSMGVGWRPTLDLPSRTADDYYDRDAQRCLDLLRKETGQIPSSTNAASASLAVCDAAYTVAAALRSVTGDFTTANLVRAFEGLGARIPSANLQQARFGPGRHDAVTVGYDMAWSSSCRCMQFARGSHTIR